MKTTQYMDKQFLIRVPSPLYKRVQEVCAREYKSMSALVRELLIERLEDSFTEEEQRIIGESRNNVRKGNVVNWRDVHRG